MKLSVPIRKAVERMRPYHPPLEGRSGKLRLDFNENTRGCSPRVLRALARIGTEAISIYPEQGAVRRNLAAMFRVSADQLLLTNGTDEALHLITNTFVENHDTVLLVEPTFAMYRFYSELAGARIKALRYDEEMGFPMAKVLQELKRRPKLFFLANPNNPTGGIVLPTQLRKLLAAATNTMLVVDEAYFEYSGITVLTWVRRHRNLIVTRTFSKAAGLAGLRIGCIFAHREVANVMRKAQSPYPVNAAALVAAQAATSDRAFLAKTIREFNASKTELERGLANLGFRPFSSAANFFLFDAGKNAKKIVARLAQHGILIRDRSSDFGGRGFLRITVGTVSQTRRVLKELKAAL
ncbi:MAG TPA: histidinol-phosphate transaminase [Candidatus Acidoferrales bacterium]